MKGGRIFWDKRDKIRISCLKEYLIIYYLINT